MSRREDLDVSELPSIAFGPRTPMWWGVILLLCIEGTMMLLLVFAYFYIRGGYDLWPPTPFGRAATSWATAGAILAAASFVPVYLSDRAARRNDLGAIRLWLVVATLLEVAFLATRAFEIAALPFKWYSSGHGSAVWVILGVHTFHLVVDSLETLVLTILYFTPKAEDKHRIDVHVNAVYWYFIAGIWLPIYAILYFDGFGTW